MSIGKKGVTTADPPQMFPFELLSMPAEPSIHCHRCHRRGKLQQRGAQEGLLTYLAAKTRSGVLVACVAKTDQGEQIKGWSGSSEYNSMFARKLPKPEKLGNYSS